MVHKLPLGSGDFVWMKTEMQVWVQSGIVEDKNIEGGQRGCLLVGQPSYEGCAEEGWGESHFKYPFPFIKPSGSLP